MKQDAGFVARNKERFNLAIDKDWSARESRLHILSKYLFGTIYDNLQPWNSEYQGISDSSPYVPLAKRRPSVIYRLPEIIVNESISMLFGEEHFPTVRNEYSDSALDFINELNLTYQINEVMLKAAYFGSIGSVCIVIKCLNARFCFEILQTSDLIPIFHWDRPEILKELWERKKYDGATLFSYGYEIKKEDFNEKFFLIRKWTDTEEIYYLPVKCHDQKSTIVDSAGKFLTKEAEKLDIDEEKSFQHNLGFVPALWGKNNYKCTDIDGTCTFEGILDISVEIDYQLSQLGRLLKYNSDPTLVIKNPSSLEGNQLIKGVGALTLDEKGDAYLLEMSNQSTVAVIDYVRCLREFALEVVRGNRANPDKISSLHSGKALQMLNVSLIGFVSELRISYGDNLLLPLYRMCAAIASKFHVELSSSVPPEEDMRELVLKWPAWYPPTPQDDMQESTTVANYIKLGIISQETALKSVADKYGVLDIEQEMGKITEIQKTLDKKTENSQNIKSQSEN